MGLVCGLAGLIIGIFFSYVGGSGGLFNNFWIWSAISAFIGGTSVWYLIIVRSDQYEPDKGAIAGVIISIISQLLLWYMKQSQKIICFYITGGCTNSFGEAPPGFLKSLSISCALLVLSLVWFGWCTIPVGGVLGWLMSVRQTHRIKRKRQNG